MINREISYERDVNRSYMKIPAMPEDNFDEKLMLKKSMNGLLSVEKCYVNGVGQYWYNISGKQALDAYCRINAVEKSFLERLILRLCEQVELLEWNLMDANCLVVDPELIFVNQRGEDISFVAYPYNKGDLFVELQQLMEYVLAKLNHSDKEAVASAYRIYELTLSESFSISELKQYILDARIKEQTLPVGEERNLRQEPEEENDTIRKEEAPSFKSLQTMIEDGKEKLVQLLDKKLIWVYETIGQLLEKTPTELWNALKKKSDIPSVVYPKQEETIVVETIHPTICMASIQHEPRGVLICEAHGEFPDFHLEKGSQVVGKNPSVQLHMDRDTISQFHARIDYVDNCYYIEDMNSTNGTYWNDAALTYKQRCRLTPGDKLRFADISYRFY